jgi:copper homeostasis protein CutC
MLPKRISNLPLAAYQADRTVVCASLSLRFGGQTPSAGSMESISHTIEPKNWRLMR